MKCKHITCDCDRCTVRQYVLNEYEGRDPVNVRIGRDGSVSVWVDRLPNTDQAGRMFAGWIDDLARAARVEAQA